MQAVSNSTLLQRFQQVRQQTETICAPLQTEDYVVQPIEEVSPPKWHLGHTTWFFENFILREYLDGYELYDEQLNFFFNSYYESQGPRMLRSNRGNMTRPSVGVVYAYRKYVDEAMARLFDRLSVDRDQLYFLVEIGCQHEQQHQELLLTDIKYILGTNPTYPAYRKVELLQQEFRPATWLDFPEGMYSIGHDGGGFSWDNEHAVHQVYLENFSLSNRLVTNGEYLEFMNAGGYQNHEFWLMEGYAWAKELSEKAPQYWHFQEGKWLQYTLHGLQEIDLHAPVTHVSYYEADAFANWSKLRLPTEFEWEVACRALHDSVPVTSQFSDSDSLHPLATPRAIDSFLGGTWEWTASAYVPYPRYPRYKGALGEYNGKFMINQMVLRGGSVATPRDHIRPTYRNFFHPDKRWQFTGIRLAR